MYGKQIINTNERKKEPRYEPCGAPISMFLMRESIRYVICCLEDWGDGVKTVS